MGEVNTLRDALTRIIGARVYFDTNPIIYFLNKTPRYFELCMPLFEAVDTGNIRACSGDLCLTELLVKPLRDKQPTQARNIKNLFDLGFIELLPHHRPVLELAAEIRAAQGLRMVDAIHAATAIHNHCNHIVTGDNGMANKLQGIHVINLNHFL